MRSWAWMAILFLGGCGGAARSALPASAPEGIFTASSPTGLGADSMTPVLASLRGRYAVYPESVVLDRVHIGLDWRERPGIRYPLRLRSLVPFLLLEPQAADTAGWYPKPLVNARRVAVAGVVHAGQHLELDSLRLVVLTRRSPVGAWRALALELETEDTQECGPRPAIPCSVRTHVLAIIRLSARGALPSN